MLSKGNVGHEIVIDGINDLYFTEKKQNMGLNILKYICYTTYKYLRVGSTE